VVTLLMCAGSIYYLEESGSHPSPVFDWGNQIQYLA